MSPRKGLKGCKTENTFVTQLASYKSCFLSSGDIRNLILAINPVELSTQWIVEEYS